MSIGNTIRGACALALTGGLLAGCTHAKEGFHTALDKHGRLWVFKAGSAELEEFLAKGEPAKQVVRPGVGPLGLTLKGPDAQTLDDYRARF